MDLAGLRSVGSHPSLQITPTPEDSDLVSRPVAFVPGAHSLQYHGGLTLSHPKLVLLWCGPPALDRTQFEQFAKELMEFGYLSKLSYAGYQQGEFLGGLDGPSLPGDASLPLLDSQLRQALTSWLAASPTTPQPDGRTIYALMLPVGVAVEFDGTSQESCDTFCAYHESELPLLYSAEPATDCGACNQGDPFAAACMTLSHEVAESISNPSGQGWYEDSTGMENADIVGWIQLQYGPWMVQGYSSPTGENLAGAYSPPAVAQPHPYTEQWLDWELQNVGYVKARYDAGDLANALLAQRQIVTYAQSILDLMASQQHVLPAALPAPGRRR